jgi:hypothetical protein
MTTNNSQSMEDEKTTPYFSKEKNMIKKIKTQYKLPREREREREREETNIKACI